MRTRLMVAAGLWAGLVAVLAPTVHAAQGGRMGPGGMMGPIGAMRPNGQPGPSGPMGPTGSMGMPNGRVALDWACVRDCGDYTLTCRHTVEESGRLCAQATCKDEAQKARASCSTAPRTIECRQAQLELRQCLLTCLEDAAGDNTACRTEQAACLGSCPPAADLGNKQPECVGGCADDFTTCLEGLVSCDTCSEPAQCSECQDALQAARRGCMRDAQSCVADCPDMTSGTGQ
jgi:hypothetical protein